MSFNFQSMHTSGNRLPRRGGDRFEDPIAWGTPAARWMLLSTVLGSGMAFLDATVVNIALPAIGTELGASVAGLQWIVNGYTLTLASLILLGGSLGDRFGRRRVFLAGVVWFAIASLLCGLAPTAPALVAARALQGVGGALLTPGSLAIIQTIGRMNGLLVDITSSTRLPPPATARMTPARRHLPQCTGIGQHGRVLPAPVSHPHDAQA